MKRLRATLIQFEAGYTVRKVRGPLTSNWARGINADLVILDRRPRKSYRDQLDLEVFKACLVDSSIRSLYIPEA